MTSAVAAAFALVFVGCASHEAYQPPDLLIPYPIDPPPETRGLADELEAYLQQSPFGATRALRLSHLIVPAPAPRIGSWRPCGRLESRLQDLGVFRRSLAKFERQRVRDPSLSPLPTKPSPVQRVTRPARAP